LLILVAVFCAVAGVQIIFLTAFIVAFQKNRALAEGSRPPVSVVVCAHDEEANLRELMPLLLAQNYPEFELVIVNDRSNDHTYDFLLEQTKLDARVRMVNIDRLPEHVNGKKFAITLGVRAAKHEWILFTDSDCRPVSDKWIDSMSGSFTEGAQFVLGFSPYERLPGFLNKFIRFETLITAIQYLSFAWMRAPYMGVGRNLAYRKSLFLEKKGFRNHIGITGGDDDLFVNQHARSKNAIAVFHPEAKVTSIPHTSWKAFLNQKVRHLSVGKHYKLRHRILLGLFTVTWVLTWFTGLPVLIVDSTKWWVALVLLIRIILLLTLVRITVKQARLTFELWAVPFLDFLYAIYYISTGLVASLTKKIRWRN
jgi:glycosyltransferase involved in cell wall biosynthesis